MIEKRKLGNTGFDATILGLGGEGVLRTYGHDKEAYELINRAIDLGINYFESARAYSGCEEYYGKALNERRDEIFLTGKSHARDKEGALKHLHESLTNMNTDRIDLWQVHDVRTDEDIDLIFGKGGAIEAFVEAKEKGLVRFIGVTGHHDPKIIRKALEIFDFDTVLVPVNPAERTYKSFVTDIVPLAEEKEIGIIAMKVYLRGFASRMHHVTTLEPFFRFALSQPVTTAVIGCDNIGQLEENVRFAHTFRSMTEIESEEVQDLTSPYARQLMYYKP